MEEDRKGRSRKEGKQRNMYRPIKSIKKKTISIELLRMKVVRHGGTVL